MSSPVVFEKNDCGPITENVSAELIGSLDEFKKLIKQRHHHLLSSESLEEVC